MLPLRIADKRLGLAKPAVLPQHVLAPIAVDVAHTESVHVRSELVVLRERVDRPARERIRLSALRPSEASARHEHELAPTVSDEVDEVRRFVVDRRRELVTRPMRLGALVLTERIAQPVSLLARKADHDDVDPAIRIKIVGPREEVIGVAFRPKLLGGVELVALAKLRTAIPPRPGDHVARAIAVEISEARAFAGELSRKLHALECDALRCRLRHTGALARLRSERAAREQRQRRRSFRTHSRMRPRHRARHRAP